MEEETLNETASPEGEQPVQEAPSDAPATDASPATETAEATPEVQPSGRQWAGKYQSPEDLERAYLESQREASRMAGELAATKRGTTTQPGAEPKYKQLESERQRWAQHLRNPNLSEQERWNADEQVRLYDREIAYERAVHDVQERTGRQTAAAQMEQEARQVISQYMNDLNNPSSQLYQAADQRFALLKQAGYPDNDATRVLAITYAAALTKTGMRSAVQNDRGDLMRTLNKKVKEAVVAGAGGPSAIPAAKGTTARDIENMSDAEFAKYERGLLGV